MSKDETNMCYVFWDYSDYPYVIGAPVSNIRHLSDGITKSYYCPTYQMWVSSNRVKFIIFDEQIAKDYLENLESLKNSFREERIKLIKIMKKKAISLIPDLIACEEYN